VTEHAEDTREESRTDAPSRPRQTARRMAEDTVKAVHTREDIIGEMQRLHKGSARCRGRMQPTSRCQPSRRS